MASINTLKPNSSQLSFSMIRKMFEDKGFFKTITEIGAELLDPEEITEHRYIKFNNTKYAGVVHPSQKRSLVLLSLLNVVPEENMDKTFKRNSPVSRVLSGYTFYSYLMEIVDVSVKSDDIDVKTLLKDYVREVAFNFKALSNSAIRTVLENTATHQSDHIKALWDLAVKDTELADEEYLKEEDLRQVRYHLSHVNEALRDNFVGPIMVNRKITDLDKLVQVWAVGELADEILKECESLTDLTLLSSSYPTKKYFEDINTKSEAKPMKTVATTVPSTAASSAANSVKKAANQPKDDILTEISGIIEESKSVIAGEQPAPAPEVPNQEVVSKVVKEEVVTTTTTTTKVTDDEAAEALADLAGLFGEVEIDLLFSKEDKKLSDIISKEVTTLENRLKEVTPLGKTLDGAFASIRTASSLSSRIDGLRNLVFLLSKAKADDNMSDKLKVSLQAVIDKLNEVITVAHAYQMATNAKDKRSIFRKALDLIVGFFAGIINLFMLVIRKIIDFFFNWNADDYKKRTPSRDPVVEPVAA
jgi:hypothetical protein